MPEYIELLFVDSIETFLEKYSQFAFEVCTLLFTTISADECPKYQRFGLPQITDQCSLFDSVPIYSELSTGHYESVFSNAGFV